MFKEFKTFIMRGNVVDMAVGIIIGAAFTSIVKSLVDDVIMPPIGLLLGNIDFSNFFIVLKDGTKISGPYATLAAGKGRRRSDAELRSFYQYDHQLPHRCLCSICYDQTGEQVQE